MIVLDEQICRARIFQDISRWYKGAVICIKDLPRTPAFLTTPCRNCSDA